MNQLWQWDAPDAINGQGTTGRIFLFDGYWSQFLTGADIFPLQRSFLESPMAMCLSGEPREGRAGASVVVRPCTGAQPGGNDPMRFSPMWVRPPLSTRFGKRSMQDAEKITDEFALDYLHENP